MTRDEFKTKINAIIDGCVDSDRELTDDDETSLIDNFGDTAQEIIDDAASEGDDAADANA